jgi:hypothetical protein
MLAVTQPGARTDDVRPATARPGARPTVAVRTGNPAGVPAPSTTKRLPAVKPRRLKVAVPVWLRLRSLGLLGVISVVIGLLAAAVLATAIGLAVHALTHAVGNGP